MKTSIKNRGISTFIATLLLMVLAVAAGIVIYAYTMGYLGGFGGTESLGSMSIDTIEAGAGGDNVTIYVRNIGKVTLNITTAYVEGDPVNLYDPNNEPVPLTYTNFTLIEEGDVGVVVLECGASTDFESGHTYDGKLIALDNTQLAFSVKAE
jgi:hypothetical protein